MMVMDKRSAILFNSIFLLVTINLLIYVESNIYQMKDSSISNNAIVLKFNVRTITKCILTCDLSEQCKYAAYETTTQNTIMCYHLKSFDFDEEMFEEGTSLKILETVDIGASHTDTTSAPENITGSSLETKNSDITLNNSSNASNTSQNQIENLPTTFPMESKTNPEDSITTPKTQKIESTIEPALTTESPHIVFVNRTCGNIQEADEYTSFPCKCFYSGYCVTLHANVSNIALEGAASQIGDHTLGSGTVASADLSIDGDLSIFSETSNSNAPWWKVQLLKTSQIIEVRIFDIWCAKCSDKMYFNNGTLSIINNITNDETICAKDIDFMTTEMKRFQCPMIGDAVKIIKYRENSVRLHMKEVEVYGHYVN